MGKNKSKKNKKKIEKPNLKNSIVQQKVDSSEEFKEEIQKLLDEHLSMAFVPKLKTRELLYKYYTDRDKIQQFWKLPKEERKAKFKLWKEEALRNHSKPTLENIQCYFVIGLRDCLRNLKKEALSLIILDEESGMESIKNLLTNSDCPLITLKRMSEITQQRLGFTSSMIGISKNSIDNDKMKRYNEISNYLKEKNHEIIVHSGKKPNLDILQGLKRARSEEPEIEDSNKKSKSFDADLDDFITI